MSVRNFDRFRRVSPQRDAKVLWGPNGAMHRGETRQSAEISQLLSTAFAGRARNWMLYCMLVEFDSQIAKRSQVRQDSFILLNHEKRAPLP